VFDACQMVQSGNFEAGIRNLGITEKGIDLGAIDENVAQDVLEVVAMYKAAIVDGAIVPPADDDSLREFRFISPEDLGAASPEASPAP
ncbi:MAG TPA: hypothetical protein VNZ58_05015, partial [Thermomicrobiales bacterium]|nr:hypothetical protein [Thermomicrobiales bacterium]